ncbi:MAG: protein kinase [candidate division KSB1 bacterium]|nr:protein kinase [candidate division KSB1 bacterium]
MDLCPSLWHGAGLVWGILFAAFSSLNGQDQADLKRAQELYEKAMQARETATRVVLLQQAAQLYSSADKISALPPSLVRQVANIHYTLGREFYQQARWELAIFHLEKAFALDPSFATTEGNLARFIAQAHNALALQLVAQGKINAASQSAHAAIRHDSTFWPAHATLGLVCFQQGKYDAAIAAYHTVLRIQPTAQLYNNLGAAYEANGNFAAAMSAYRRALELDPRLAVAQRNFQRAQEKLAHVSLISVPEENPKPATSESTQPASNQNDSLVVAKAPSKAKPAGESRMISGKEKAKTLAETMSNAQPNKKGMTKTTQLRSPQGIPSSPSARKSKQDTVATKAGISSSVVPSGRPTKPILDQNARPAAAPNDPPRSPESIIDTTRRAIAMVSRPSPSIPRAISRSASSYRFLFPFLCGAGVVVLIMLAFAQRQRLSRVWLQIKPIRTRPAAEVTDSRRLLAAGTLPEAVANELPATEVKLLPAASPEVQMEVAAVESSAGRPDGSVEPRPPSLQTQAFFAEMIAGEPEFEEFEKEDQAQEGKPDNGQLLSSIVSSAQTEEIVHLDEAPRVTTSEVESSNGSAVETPALETSSTSQQFTRSDASNQPSVPSHSAAEMSIPRDMQSQRSKDAESSGDHTPGHKSQTLGRYFIKREIGKGAMGNIYLAWDPKLDRRVVIKTVCFNRATSEEDTAVIKDRIYREARAIAKLGHPNIVVVYDIEDEQDLSYIVMEHIEGRDLRQVLAREHRFDCQRAINIVAQVCNALDYAHQAGIIHRDIKPSNIMLLPGDKAKVTDFGIAKIADNFSLTLPGHILGTPSYMAPEQFEGGQIDGRADIFSLGVVFYELITGTRPFTGDSLAALAYKIVHKMHLPPSLQNVELPFELDEIVGRALAKQPEERYQTAKEFHEALLGVSVEMVT